MHPDERLIGEYVDEAFEPERRSSVKPGSPDRWREVERHLEGCEACRRLVADLREIRRTAASLDPREPPVRAWTRIERAIRLEAEHRSAASGSSDIVGANAVGRGNAVGGISAAGRPGRSPAPASGGRVAWISRSWLAAAAVLVLAAVIGIRYGRRDVARPPAPPSDVRAVAGGPGSQGSQGLQGGSASADAGAFVEAELREAESHYDNAIKGLEQIAAAEKGTLDPATAAALQKNLAVIDQAISESRAAVRAQPTSEPARDSLMESFRTKLALLQDTVALINELRKGNEAGTARAVSGLKQKGD